MYYNLTEVFQTHTPVKREQINIEMTIFDSGIESFEILSSTPVEFVFTNISQGKARINGTGQVTLQMQCNRCLKDVEEVIDLDFELEVCAPEYLDEDSDEQAFMEGYVLDTEELISNEILMSLPAKVLCKDDCKGICMVCGKDLNLGECGCDTFVPDPRMAAIKDIFNANKEV